MLLYFVVVNFVIHQLIRVVYILDRLYVQYMYIPFKAFLYFVQIDHFRILRKTRKLDSFVRWPRRVTHAN